MNPIKRYFYLTKFKLLMYQKNGYEFQDFFCNIMQNSDPDFERVKPQGQKGDRKNDGFNRKKGIYYQVYGPENLATKHKEAIDKLETDFMGLYGFWNELFKINKFCYVVNDKYLGNFPDLYVAISNLEKSYKNISFEIVTAKKTEDLFFKLPEQVIVDCLGLIPDEDDLNFLEFDILGEVIEYLIRNEKPLSRSQILSGIDPNFNKKIALNNLHEGIGNLLKAASLLTYMVDDFYSDGNHYTKSEVYKLFQNLYHEASKEFAEKENRTDLIFFYILEHACPNKNDKRFSDATIILISYYFELCDIFEPPILEKK